MSVDSVKGASQKKQKRMSLQYFFVYSFLPSNLFFDLLGEETIEFWGSGFFLRGGIFSLLRGAVYSSCIIEGAAVVSAAVSHVVAALFAASSSAFEYNSGHMDEINSGIMPSSEKAS